MTRTFRPWSAQPVPKLIPIDCPSAVIIEATWAPITPVLSSNHYLDPLDGVGWSESKTSEIQLAEGFVPVLGPFQLKPTERIFSFGQSVTV